MAKATWLNRGITTLKMGYLTGPYKVSIKAGTDTCGVGQGTLDEVRWWNRALNQTEISNNSSTCLTGSENGLMAYFPFDQGIAGQDNSTETTAIDFLGDCRRKRFQST